MFPFNTCPVGVSFFEVGGQIFVTCSQGAMGLT